MSAKTLRSVLLAGSTNLWRGMEGRAAGGERGRRRAWRRAVLSPARQHGAGLRDPAMGGPRR